MSYSTKVLNTLSSKDFLKMSTLSYMMDKNSAVYGREIITHIQEKDTVWKPSHGSLYPLLSEMVDEKLLYIDDEVGKRKFYQMTNEGREYYKKAASEFVEMLITTSNFYADFAKDLYVDFNDSTSIEIDKDTEVKGA